MTYRIGVASNNGFPRLFIDPLQGVRNLESAYERAAALGASDSDRTCLAWAVLLANAASAQTGRRPLQSWINLFAPPTDPASDERIRWARLIAQLHDDTGLTTTVTIDEVIGTAQRYLLPWAEDWLGAHGLHFNAIDESGSTQLTWGLNTANHRSVEWTPDHSEDVHAPQLWLCEPAVMNAVPAILSDQHVANLLLDGLSLKAAGSPQPEFVWCPVGAGDRHAALWELGVGRWHSAVLY